MGNKDEVYDGNQIDVLEGLEAVRVRPAMYIGSTSSKGLHHLIWEILDNAVDEHLGGYCNEIDITLQKDGGIKVKDNGRGVPVDIHPKKKIPTERVIYTILHAGGKFNNGAYKVSGGLHGVGSSVVNALSKRMIVYVQRNGNVYKDEYSNGGHPIEKLVNGNLPIVDHCNKNNTGTTVIFYPDEEIFDSVKFKTEIIEHKLQEIAYLNKGLILNYTNEFNDETYTYVENEGIKSYVNYLVQNEEVIHDEPIYIEGISNNIEAEISFQYTKNYNEQINSFCNRINMVEGGTLVTGFKLATTRIMNQYARELGLLKEKDENLDGKDIRNGIVCIISIKHPDPQFEGQTKTKLNNVDAKNAVDEIISDKLVKYFDANVEVLKVILENAINSSNARKASDKARTSILKGLSNDTEYKSKLASCSSKNPEEIEIYIVEGDSAGGTVKTARNRRIQAVLPLRGKILNVEKAPLEKILVNNEIKNIIVAFGCGISDDFDINKLKYSKIIILSDADVDGAHIETLLLTFFYRFMPEIIKNGNVYRGLVPLYKVEYAKNGSNKKYSKYLLDDYELEKFRETCKIKEYTITGLQRYKGLGEMDADQLWETVLNPDTRHLSRITISDTIEADQTTTLLMGNEVPPRREFIIKEAKYANLDI